MKRTLKPVFPPAGIEKEYEKRLKKAVRKMEKSVVYWLSAKYRQNESRITDSATDDLLQAFRRLLHQWEKYFRELCETLPRWFVSKIRGYVSRNLVEQTRPLRDAGLGFNLKFSYMSQAERQVFAAIVAENVNLIKSIAHENLTQVEGIILRGITSGNDLFTVKEQLHKQFGVSERRAAMIARDQTAKATNNLSRQRLMDYGITRGIWMHTSAGKTYRETHVEDMNGVEYNIKFGCFDPDPKVNRAIQPAELVNCHCVCRPVVPAFGQEDRGEQIFGEVEGENLLSQGTNGKKDDIIALTRTVESSMERRTENQGEFAHLQVPMQERYVDRLCNGYGLDISDLTIKIQRDPAWLSTAFAGMADPKNIGRIDLLPNAFIDEEQLIRTIIHEGAHVKQYKKYGARYVQNNRRRMETVAERYEDLFYNIVKRRRRK